MASEFQVHILSADRDFYEGPCTSLTLPALDGQLGILAHHSNMVAAIVPGELRYRLHDGTERVAVVSHGLVRVEQNDVLILVDSAERPEEIDAVRAREDLERAKEELLHQQSWQEYLQTQASLSRAMNRLKAVHKR